MGEKRISNLFYQSLEDKFCSKLQKLDKFRSWYVFKNVAWSLVVYISVMIAFASAFHCFLCFNDVFEGPATSLLKVLTMVLGEFDFEDNFVYVKVKENHGSNLSVQVLLIFFIIYGSLIIMNLVTAWIVINQHEIRQTNVILAKQRIQELSGMTVLAPCNQKDNEDIPSKLCTTPVEDSSISFLKHILNKLNKFLDDDCSPSWAINEHTVTHDGLSYCCKALPKNTFLPSHTETCIDGLTTEMFKDKKEKQTQLIYVVKESKRKTERRLQKLIIKRGILSLLFKVKFILL